MSTPARLSSLATTTLSQILELTRATRLNLPPSPSLTNSIKKNLQSLQKGIDSLAEQEGADSDVVRALSEQEERLVGLLEGLGVEAGRPGRGVKQGKTGRLVDTGEEDPLGAAEPADDADSEDGLPLLNLSKSHTAIDMPDSRFQMEQDEEAMRKANSEVMQMQRQMMSDQDDTLTSLSSAISRQHALSLNISSELELHEDLIDDTDHAIDRTSARLRQAGNHLTTVGRKAKSTGSTGLIVLLVVILVVLLTIFKS